MMNRIGRKLGIMALLTMFATSVHCAEKALDELPLCYLSTEEADFPTDGTKTELLKDSRSAVQFVQNNYAKYRFVLNFSSTRRWLSTEIASVAGEAKDHLIELYYPEKFSMTGTEFDVTSFTELTKLSIRNNEKAATITGLSKCTKLRELNVENTGLTELDVSKLSNLKRLFANGCTIATLKGISKCTKLEELNAEETNITSLELDGCTSLTQLIIRGHHKLTTLKGISKCTKLEELNVAGSNITSLELDGCTSLTRLMVGGCHELTKIKASKTKVTKIDYYDCRGLKKMDAKALKKAIEAPVGCEIFASND